jgi:hypothetical protein
MGKKSISGYEILDEHIGLYFLELRNNLLVKKYLKSLMRIRDSGSGIFLTLDPG